MRKTLEYYLPSVFGKPSKLPPSVLKEIKAKQAAAKSKVQANVKVLTPTPSPAKNDVPVVNVKQRIVNSVPAVDINQTSLSIDSVFVDNAGHTLAAWCEEGVTMECNDEDFIAIMQENGFNRVFNNSACIEPEVSLGAYFCSDNAVHAKIFLNQCNVTYQTIPQRVMNNTWDAILQKCYQDVDAYAGIVLGSTIGAIAFLICVCCCCKIACDGKPYPLLIQNLIDCFQRCKRDRSNAHLQSEAAGSGLLVNSQLPQSYASVGVQSERSGARSTAGEEAAAASASSAPKLAPMSVAS